MHVRKDPSLSHVSQTHNSTCLMPSQVFHLGNNGLSFLFAHVLSSTTTIVLGLFKPATYMPYARVGLQAVVGSSARWYTCRSFGVSTTTQQEGLGSSGEEQALLGWEGYKAAGMLGQVPPGLWVGSLSQGEGGLSERPCRTGGGVSGGLLTACLCPMLAMLFAWGRLSSSPWGNAWPGMAQAALHVPRARLELVLLPPWVFFREASSLGHLPSGSQNIGGRFCLSFRRNGKESMYNTIEENSRHVKKSCC